MGKLFLRPTRRDVVVALMGMVCALLFTRMFDLSLQDVPARYTHDLPDILAPVSRPKLKQTYRPQRVPQDDDVPKPAPVPVIPKRESRLAERLLRMSSSVFSRRARRRT
jgi:hypothetical protein